MGKNMGLDMVGTFLTSSMDELSWLKLMHRGTFVVSHDAEYPSNKCRACQYALLSGFVFLRFPGFE